MSAKVAARFVAATTGWRTRLQADEWFFATLRQELVAPLSLAEAFESIGGVVGLLLREPDDALCAEAAELLVALARQSGTTEMPPVLGREWDRVAARLGSLGGHGRSLAAELAAWYRRRQAGPS